MTSFTNRGRALYSDVLNIERTIFSDQNAGKKVQQLKLRLESIINDFDRQVKNLLEKIPSNKRGQQNVINIRSKKVKNVKVAEMNNEIKKLKKLTNGNTSTSVGASSNIRSKLLNKLTEIDERVSKVGSVIE